MKITKENFATLKKSIEQLLTNYPNVVEQYETGGFVRAEKVKDLQKRFCFDLLHCAGLKEWTRDTLYGENNLSNEHIYTALKRICPTVIKRY